MSNNRYIEFDSTYRNRNEWPLASEFEIPISQSGRKGQYDALDPVCLSTPLFAWSSNAFYRSSPSLDNIAGLVANPATFPVAYTDDPSILILETNFFQQLKNYYVNAVLELSQGGVKKYRRIIEYTFLGITTVGAPPVELAQVTLSSPLPDGYIVPGTTTFIIYDPTDISDTSNPQFFIPAGRIQKNAYNSYLLYNETQNQYRKVSGYNFDTHLLTVDTTGSVSATSTSGPITGWGLTDNYSLRKEAPNYPTLNGTNPVVVSATTSVITISGTNPSSDDYYKNCALRILPASGTYEYDLTSPNGDSRIITSSTYSAGNLTLTVSPAFGSAPVVGTDVEILFFSYDNLNPFTYTGSLVSQQQMVCYEIELLNVILPNETLAVGEGGRIAFYPYVYVEISNVSAAEARLKNIIYSNNPNAVKVTFRVPIDDVINPIISNYVRVDGDGMVQTIKFKPNDNLFFRVTLANGESYETILPEYYSPSPPNPSAQISAAFSIRRL